MDYSIYSIRKDILPEVEEVLLHNFVFFLSTGRCGTALITKILEDSNKLIVYHDPIPILEYAFSHIFERNPTIESKKLAILASRFDHMFAKAKQENKIYIETNCRITFFADALSKILPNSKFIHITRDPKDYVTSGMCRNYYKHESVQYQRLSTNSEYWNNLNQIEKITYEWNSINGFVEDFKDDLRPKRHITFKCEDIFKDSKYIHELINFIDKDLEFGESFIRGHLKTPVNSNLNRTFPSFENWNLEQKKSFEDLIDENLSLKYEY